MPLYRSPEERASETVTIRLTIRERRMLDHLAKLDEKTLTDFIRCLIAKRADELGIDEPPPKVPKRRPGRPKMKKTEPPADIPKTDIAKTPDAIADEVADLPTLPPTREEADIPPVKSPPPEDDIQHDPRMPVSPPKPAPAPIQASTRVASPPMTELDMEGPTVGQLIERFQDTFEHRAEGTKRELQETMDFFFSDKKGPPIIPMSLPISDLSSELLKEVRDAVKSSKLRLAKKNLHLTYFRMLLHFGVKERDFDIRVNPSRDLEPLSITESNESWRFFTGRSD